MKTFGWIRTPILSFKSSRPRNKPFIAIDIAAVIFGLNIISDANFLLLILLPNFKCRGIRAVSYTHLDVYKRQAYTILFPMPYKCLIAPGHPLAGQSVIRLEELAGYRVGMLRKNPELSKQLSERCPGLDLEIIMNTEIQNIINICYNNGVFLSKAYYINSLQPLVAIPLETNIIPMGAILHRESPSQVVKEFLRVVRDLYPQGSPGL